MKQAFALSTPFELAVQRYGFGKYHVKLRLARDK
jgi:hypothetical protein